MTNVVIVLLFSGLTSFRDRHSMNVQPFVVCTRRRTDATVIEPEAVVEAAITEAAANVAASAAAKGPAASPAAILASTSTMLQWSAAACHLLPLDQHGK